MSKKTGLFEQHIKSGALMVNFAGWLMPLHYGSQIQEHHSVRNEAGIFDVSHMAIIDIQGQQASLFLRQLLANDVKKISPGRALYSCMLNDAACVLDDLIVYCISDTLYRLVVNASTEDKDLKWIKEQAKPFEVTIQSRRDLSILAIQGPKSLERMKSVFNEDQNHAMQSLTPFGAVECENVLIARTGYTGEEGLEVMLPHELVNDFWEKCLASKIKPIGLGARDSLRLESGFNLYGQDMDETVTPLESNLGWTVDWKDNDRDFIGKKALQKQMDSGVKQQLVGVVLMVQGVCRANMKVQINDETAKELFSGKLTSGGFSPTLNCGIALARIPMGDFSFLEVDIRSKQLPAKIIKLPFVKKGAPNFSL